MRRVESLILAARGISRNLPNSDGTNAVSDEIVLQYLNDAQDRMQNLMSAKKNIAKIFVTQQLISIVANQEEYSLTNRLLLNKQIECVEFSSTGALTDYVILEKLNFINRDTNTTTYPWGYIKRGGQILVQPTPSGSQGTLRVTFERALDDLDIARGYVSSIGTGTSTSFVSLTLTAAADAFETTNPGWSTASDCSVSAISSPTLRAKRIGFGVGGYNTGTNVITPYNSLYTYNTTSGDESQIVVGDAVTFGKYTTIWSQLPDDCERYLIRYAATELFLGDSSNDYSNSKELLDEMERDIITALESQTSEVQYVPQGDRSDWF